MTNREKKPPTLRDVARLADVSYQTVSRVINSHPSVSRKTRERVEEAIVALNFRPNRAAQALNTGRSHTLQIVTFDLAYATYLLPGLILRSRDLGYLTAFSAIYDSSADAEFNMLLDTLAGRVFDGFVWISFGPARYGQAIAEWMGDSPYIMVGADASPQQPSVIYNQHVGALLALDHLYALGHRNIAEISGWLGSIDGEVRHASYINFMKEKGQTPNWVEGRFAWEHGYQGVQALLERGQHFSGLVCGNDKTAFGALAALNARGLRVPQDVSVIGYDDMEGMNYTIPSLTTVRQEFGLMARQAIDDLVTMIEKPGLPPIQRVLTPQLVVRESTSII